MALATTALAGQAAAQGFEMDEQSSEDLDLLYFDPPQTYLTPHVTRSFYNSYQFQKKLFDWEPWDDSTTVLLKDFGDYGNAAARSAPNNALMIDVAPLSRTFETFTASERVYSLMNHELVHVATMDVWNESDDKWRKIFFGKPMPEQEHPETILYSILATPRVNVPRWYLEGSAVFVETWMAGGLGRAQGAYDEMVFRAMTRDDAKFYSALGLVSEGTKVDFQGGVNAYLYGTRFMNFLAYTYGPEKLVEWLSRNEGSKAYYSAQFRQVFGKKLTDVWRDWIAFEKDFQNANLERVREHPLTATSPLVDRAMGSVSRAFYDADRDTLIGAFRFPGTVAHVGEVSLATGEATRLKDIKGPMLYKVTSLAFDPDADKLYYTSDNYAFRDVREIDLATGRERMLIKDSRIGELVINPADKTMWGIRHLNGYPTLVRMDPPYTAWTQVHTWPYGGDLSDLDISPDGALLAATVGQVTGDQELHVYRLADLEEGTIEPIATYKPNLAIPEGAAFSPDGRYVYGNTYFTGVSNIFRLEVATGEVEFVSNAETGFFRPLPLADGSLIVFEYTGAGFTPVKIDPVPLEEVSSISFLGTEIVRKHPVLETWGVGSPTKVDLDSLGISQSKYHPRERIALGSAYPVTLGYKDGVAAGYHFNFDDPMQFNQLDITVGYSLTGDITGAEKLHADVHFKGIAWWARWWHNYADFYDLFGPTKRARKGDAFLLGYRKALIFDEPRTLDLEAEVGFYTGLDRLPSNQNVFTDFNEILSGAAELHYSNTQKSLGAVDHEKGWQWNAGLNVDHASKITSTKLFGGINAGVALPWANSSLWTYNAAGVAIGDDASPLSSFYFGGFKNNYVDDREVRRYRSMSTLPGFEIDELAAESFVKTTAEFNLPPVRFAEVGMPSLYLGYLAPSLFASALWVDPGSKDDFRAYSLGAQVDLHFTLAHRLDMTLSLGYANGFRESGPDSDEILVSLKIM
ncbi:hypothetical protein [Sphingomicrobium nitratireducens]|uniref:hypothetical protein n=1 Tax=Sphingomicrobium nitratireducens TaxID=2964666 RepID=UPI00223F87E3|nr:hypothetical protein [Sphingomicrobium nitratireducens]